MMASGDVDEDGDGVASRLMADGGITIASGVIICTDRIALGFCKHDESPVYSVLYTGNENDVDGGVVVD